MPTILDFIKEGDTSRPVFQTSYSACQMLCSIAYERFSSSQQGPNPFVSFLRRILYLYIANRTPTEPVSIVKSSLTPPSNKFFLETTSHLLTTCDTKDQRPLLSSVLNRFLSLSYLVYNQYLLTIYGSGLYLDSISFLILI